MTLKVVYENSQRESYKLNMKNLFLGFALAMLSAGAAFAQEHKYVRDVAIDDQDVALGGLHYSPFLDQSYPNRVFWGDTHLHTSYSTDAGMIGNTLGPDETKNHLEPTP